MNTLEATNLIKSEAAKRGYHTMDLPAGGPDFCGCTIDKKGILASIAIPGSFVRIATDAEMLLRIHEELNQSARDMHKVKRKER